MSPFHSLTNVPVVTPEPAGWFAQWLRKAAAYSALARRAQGLTYGGEWPRPHYDLVWPAGLDEMDPDITRQDLPVNLSTIIHNLITSQAVPEIVSESGGTPVRTRVGHSYIKAEMARTNAVFGGEHSAHYYFRDFWFADTGMLAAMHVLAALGAQDQPLSVFAAAYERYSASGEINDSRFA